MKGFVQMGSISKIKKIIKDNFKERIIFITILLLVILSAAYIYKGNYYQEFSGEKQNYFIISNEKVEQVVELKDREIIELSLKVGKNKPTNSSIYKVSLLDNNSLIVSIDIDTLTLSEEQYVNLVIPQEKRGKYSELKIVIESNNMSEDNGLKIYGSNSFDFKYSINNQITDNTLYMKIMYERFSISFFIIMLLIFLTGTVLILTIDLKRLHNSVFLVIVLMGTLITILNPILDTPDDHAHLCRAEFTSRGIFSFKDNVNEYKISNSLNEIIKNNFKTVSDTNLAELKIDNSYDSTYVNYAESNTFIGYIPQAIGIVIAKVFFEKVISIVIMGRLINLLVYAFMIRYAIKIAPLFKIPLSIISISPMAIYIAASFNPDMTTYGLVFIIIAYFLYLYKRENIELKNIVIYSVLCIVLGLVKLPYCVLGGAILFMPKRKFKSNRFYYLSYAFVVIIAIISLIFGLSILMGGSEMSSFGDYHTNNNINSSEQIRYILLNPLIFIRNFMISMIDNITMTFTQINTFGWLTYGLNSGIKTIYILFLGAVIFMYPTKEELANITKIGLFIIVVAVYVITSLIMYITWSPVGGANILGVQGRYFIPAIGILTLLSSGSNNKENSGTDFKYIFIALIFLALTILFIVNNYY